MLMDQHCFWPEGSVSDVKGQETYQTAAELVRAYDAQAHEIVDAISAAVIGAQAGSNWLRAQPANLEEVQKSLDAIARDGKRAAEIVLRLRTSMNGWSSRHS